MTGYRVQINIPEGASAEVTRAIELWMQAANATMNVLATAKPEDDAIVNAVLDAGMKSLACVAAPMNLDRNQRRGASKKLEALIVAETDNFKRSMAAMMPQTMN